MQVLLFLKVSTLALEQGGKYSLILYISTHCHKKIYLLLGKSYILTISLYIIGTRMKFAAVRKYNERFPDKT